MSPNKHIHFWIYPNFEQRLTQFFRELSAWKEIPFPRSIIRKENPQCSLATVLIAYCKQK